MLATILALGILIRTLLGAALFLISYYQLPVFRSMQLGGGFWTLALDARSYFHMAASAVASGLSSIPAGSPSPGYVRALTVWLELFGVSPASGILLNLGCYVIVALIVVEASASVTFAAIALGALTFSPALIIFGTQVLKDSVCVLLTVLAFAGASLWGRATSGTTGSPRTCGIAGATTLSGAVLGLAAIRAYFAFFIVASVIVMGVAALMAASDRSGRLKGFAAYAGLVVVLWTAFMVGAGAYYSYYGSLVNGALGHPFQSTAELDRARAGFIATGGATSVSDDAPEEAPPLAIDSGSAAGPGVVARFSRTLRGCAVLFVPITLLRATSLVSFTGGQGLLFVTDVDTLVMDLGIVAALLLLFKRGLSRSSLPVALFALTLAALTSLSMAYVVTNFGTAFRLRLLAATPLWVLPAFVRTRSGTAPKPTRQE
jgi:hypothetical protein